ncbi:MAG: hypothetical protein IT281_01435 [Ignavibacteria bacterium]|nr:hypothetical protein [Ignavibacteria bacterium]
MTKQNQRRLKDSKAQRKAKTKKAKSRAFTAKNTKRSKYKKLSSVILTLQVRGGKDKHRHKEKLNGYPPARV